MCPDIALIVISVSPPYWAARYRKRFDLYPGSSGAAPPQVNNKGIAHETKSTSCVDRDCTPSQRPGFGAHRIAAQERPLVRPVDCAVRTEIRSARFLRELAAHREPPARR